MKNPQNSKNGARAAKSKIGFGPEKKFTSSQNEKNTGGCGELQRSVGPAALRFIGAQNCIWCTEPRETALFRG